MKNKQESINILRMYGESTLLEIDEFIKKFNVTNAGLNKEEVALKLKKNGFNEIKGAKQKHWYNFLIESTFTPFNYILMGIAGVLYYTDVILAKSPNYTNIIVVLAFVFISMILNFWEEYRSYQKANKLKEMVQITANVLRNKKQMKVPSKEIVVGDIIEISAGDLVPADIRLIETMDLYISQSSLTGESDTVKKGIEQKNKNVQAITDLENICFMGTNVISGYAKGVVIKTGQNTYFGKVAHLINLGKEKTSFQSGIENVSKLLIRFMVAIIPITFLANVWKHDTITAFTFSVAIAIGITPLLLPVILSSTLSQGAIKMSKKKTIVKKLDSIQSFGAMNILCTDKTGTLTEDRIVLEKYLNIKGEEDKRVLRHAFLNSYFQSGLKGNIDIAVVNRAQKEELKQIVKEYEKIDEIPFDFTRRRLSVVVKKGEKKQLISKGAVEEILNICKYVDYNSEVTGITEGIKKNILKITKNLNKEGMRVIAVAQKNDILDVEKFSINDEENMVLMGFIGFLDPPKESAKESILELNTNQIRVIVLTGDNEVVTKSICEKVDINTSRIITGSEIDKLSDMALLRILKDINVFAKLSPIQKARIIRLLRKAGNIVGFMGDGINDAPSLINAEVGISVDTGSDIAKENADIILLQKDLKVLVEGVREGRKTFGNLQKYIKMAASFNFGEVMSVFIASIFLPFFPITPIQLLVQSLLYDIGQLSLPFDNVDKEYLEKPQRWSVESLKRFMLYMGPLSSCFDLLVFVILWFGFKLRAPQAAIFQTIWFSYGVVSNLVGLHVIRTTKTKFLQNNASKAVYVTSILFSILAILLPFTVVGNFIGLVPLSFKYISVIIIIPIIYDIVAVYAKKKYIKRYGEWL
ncbi:MAG: magnesium-translocating P-type ATPase [Clostridia bacterium]|nr:magnesium-translocating P-type ATPase [Clostridia bacterium]